MKALKKKPLIYILVLIISCVVSVISTLAYNGIFSAKNEEDKMLESLFGKEKANSIENGSYSYQRTYILKDGTTISASGGTSNQEFK